MKEYYENKVAAVTGGASGIGLAVAEAMLEMGARAVTIADIIEKQVDASADGLSRSSGYDDLLPLPGL